MFFTPVLDCVTFRQSCLPVSGVYANRGKQAAVGSYFVDRRESGINLLTQSLSEKQMQTIYQSVVSVSPRFLTKCRV